MTANLPAPQTAAQAGRPKHPTETPEYWERLARDHRAFFEQRVGSVESILLHRKKAEDYERRAVELRAAAPPRQEQGDRPYGLPLALLHGIAFDDRGYLAIEEPAAFRARFGDEATIRTAARFIDEWSREVDDAWRDAVETWAEQRAEERAVDAWEARNQ